MVLGVDIVEIQEHVGGVLFLQVCVISHILLLILQYVSLYVGYPLHLRPRVGVEHIGHPLALH